MTHPARPERDDEDVELPDDPGLDIAVLRRRREIVLTILALGVILIVAIVASRKFSTSVPTSESELLVVAQAAIREALPGAQLAMGTPDEMAFAYHGDRRFDAVGQFSAIYPDGKSVYYKFRCSIERAEDSHLRPLQLQLTPLF